MITEPFDTNLEVAKYLTESQQEALARMTNVISSNGLGILSGEIGSGKTTILRTLTADLPASKHTVIYICSANLTPKDLYSAVVRELGEEPSFMLPKIKQQWYRLLSNELMDGKRLVLLIDEAHELTTNTLLELRFLLNCKMDLTPAFSVILSGQPRLRNDLRLKAFEAIAQRVKMQYHITGMTLEETAKYINFKMTDAAVQRPLFGESAIELIHSSTQGIPRVINQICRHAYHSANKNNDSVIEEKHIVAILADMDRQRGIKM